MMKISKPQGIARGLKFHKKCRKSIFSMPGHKGNFHPLNKALKTYADVTEVGGVEKYGTDSLFCTHRADSGIIGTTEKKISKIYGSAFSCISAGGSTACIQTILGVMSRFGNKIIVNRNCHVSVINTCGLLNLDIIWVYPHGLEKFGISGQIAPKDIEEAFEKNRNELPLKGHGQTIAGVFITSPDYFGIMADLKKISEICKKNDSLFCVDNAHGAHLIMVQGEYSKSNIHPMTIGVDMCCDSAHKTLPALTGAAYLHVGKNFAQAQKQSLNGLKGVFKDEMSRFCSTSPSYLIMQSIDLVADYMLSARCQSDYLNLEKKVSVINKFAKESGFEPIKDHACTDPCRISMVYDYSPKINFEDFMKANRVECEYIGDGFVVLIPSPFNKEKDFKRLAKAISQFRKANISVQANRTVAIFPCELQDQNQKKMTVTEATHAAFETMSVTKSKGRVAAQTVSICPPGITPIIPGEIICEKTIKLLKNYGIFDVKVIK